MDGPAVQMIERVIIHVIIAFSLLKTAVKILAEEWEELKRFLARRSQIGTKRSGWRGPVL